ncbi:tRNA (adenosine(37)-N6)-threonylcarbamoyltransferase complex transferase subunit TsaD [Nannocystis pusilla]|uniref:tRNA (adenosine(37)-N6)-threonylcarbamoyltransferase complex transferase subunit TsaD n=1 Tax=Nannocystis pusilla TaxID=889268 RepID=UPI003BF0FAF7
MAAPRILALESSCDETACAVVEGLFVRASVVASQVELHAQFGGVVPELASRHHLTAAVPVVREALARAGVGFEWFDAIGVTEGPGLVGALLVAVQLARGLSLATGLPLVGVHHMEGHLVSPFLGDADSPPAEFAPHLALSVSGGHSELVHVQALGRYEVLGSTRDDAAGEAFDKAAKLLGLGYPGGPVIDRLAAEGDPNAVPFPRAMLGSRENLEFSFSGLKTAVAVYVDQHGQPSSRQALADVCASFQAAVVSVLVAKLRVARRRVGTSLVTIVGGVSANSGLRAALAEAAARDGFTLRAPPLRYCGDNAAMIGGAAALRRAAGLRREPPVEVYASLALDEGRARDG